MHQSEWSQIARSTKDTQCDVKILAGGIVGCNDASFGCLRFKSFDANSANSSRPDGGASARQCWLTVVNHTPALFPTSHQPCGCNCSIASLRQVLLLQVRASNLRFPDPLFSQNGLFLVAERSPGLHCARSLLEYAAASSKPPQTSRDSQWRVGAIHLCRICLTHCPRAGFEHRSRC